MDLLAGFAKSDEDVTMPLLSLTIAYWGGILFTLPAFVSAMFSWAERFAEHRGSRCRDVAFSMLLGGILQFILVVVFGILSVAWKVHVGASAIYFFISGLAALRVWGIPKKNAKFSQSHSPTSVVVTPAGEVKNAGDHVSVQMNQSEMRKLEGA